MLSDTDAAAIYDVLNRWDPSSSSADNFFHELLMSASAVLDVGCGTGLMLHHARAAGHTGRLVGIDPDGAALDRARRRDDVEWLLCAAADLPWDQEFDLAIMASHAFQCLVDDEELECSLEAIWRALKPGGQFAFDTRHPQARAWIAWTQTQVHVESPTGEQLTVSYVVHSVEGDVVTLSEVYADPSQHERRRDTSRLRFLGPAELRAQLTKAGFEIVDQFGDGSRAPITPESEEIVTIARRA